MLVEAERQGNLPGPLGIDALPQPGRSYQRGESPAGSSSEFESTPNLFDNSDHSQRAIEGPIDPEDADSATPAPELAGSDDPVGFTVN